ncbi:hypothetical protein Pla123a_45020 [Posidoniimonas polymericola]|uniref:Uncharacterized protein n=1 Tax=Posidoniimonas polymericola TaxID=2528002 RepID=A0A5C5XV46_9BACT|nr:hypothetical protein Pla123a_45020 [Posidoniimonas polymericola]
MKKHQAAAHQNGALPNRHTRGGAARLRAKRINRAAFFCALLKPHDHYYSV